MTTELKATVKPVKKTMQVRESLVPKIKELYPNIVIADNDFKYDDVQSVKHAEFYFEDPVDYTEIKKLIESVKFGYPTVIVRLVNRELDSKLLDFLAVSRYVFSNDDYTIVMAQKGYSSPVFHIKEKFRITKLIQIKG